MKKKTHVNKVKDWFNKTIGKKKVSPPEPQANETIRRQTLELEKEEATKAGKPWVAVIDTQVNPKDIKNGFFELDWNNEFIEQLLDAGYSGETSEQIVDAWFRTIVIQMLEEEGQSSDRGMGYIKVAPLDKDKSEVS